MEFIVGDRVSVSRGDVAFEGVVDSAYPNFLEVEIEKGVGMWINPQDVPDGWAVEKVVPPIAFKPFAVVKVVPHSIDDAWGWQYASRMVYGAGTWWQSVSGGHVGGDAEMERLIASGEAEFVFEGVDL